MKETGKNRGLTLFTVMYPYQAVVIGLACILGRPSGLAAEQTAPSENSGSGIVYVTSKVVSGFYIVLTDEYGTTNTTTDRRLCLSIVNQEETNAWLIFPSMEYAYQVELTQSNGVPVPKTAAGRRAGSRFANFNAVYAGTRGAVRQMFTTSTKERLDLRALFRPGDLFQISAPGKYTLFVRFQIMVFPQVGMGTTGHTNKIITFPPMAYPLLKKEPLQQTRKSASKGVTH